MDKQYIFNKVVNHALTQRVQALGTHDGLCMYRDDTGKKCFVGALIPDELYSPGMEGNNILGLLALPIGRELRKLLEIGDDKDEGFLVELQSIHDNFTPDQWPHKLTEVAELHGLHIPEKLGSEE